MSALNKNQIINHWCEKILKGEQWVSLKRIRELQIPEELRSKLMDRGKEVLANEVRRVISSGYLGTFPDDEQSNTFGETLRELLYDRIILPAPEVTDIIEKHYDPLLEDWQMTPISFREAAEDPSGLSFEIFRRMATLVEGKVDDGSESISVIAQVCELSGLPTISLALHSEARLGTESLEKDDLSLIITRLLKLKERYKIGRRLTCAEGDAITLEASAVETPVVEPVIHRPIPIKSVEAAVVEPLVAKEIAEPVVEAAPEPAAGVKPLPGGIHEDERKLYEELMEPDKMNLFVETMFRDEVNEYKLAVLKICKQKKLKSALVIADNTLFIMETPLNIPPVVQFMHIIHDNFIDVE